MSPPRVAVIGGGVSACTLAYALCEQLSARSLELTIFEMGRGAGGRMATRRTREKPELRVDHGVPAFEAYTDEFVAFCDDLTASSVLKRCTSPLTFGSLLTDGSFEAESGAGAVTRYAAADGQGMSSLCDALLRVGNSEAPLSRTRFGTMVTEVEQTANGWHLSSKQGDDLGYFDWLVVTSTGFAHPRWRSAFGGEPPLVNAATSLGDEALNAALATLAPLTAHPVVACLLAFEGDAAAAWARLPFFKASVDADAIIDKVVVQRVTTGLTAVVLHSTHQFAQQNVAVYGATSTAARVAGAASDADKEAQVCAAMLSATEQRLGGLLDASHLQSPAWGPHLHRWGAAFPGEPLLPSAHAVVPSAKVAFCGDFVDYGNGRAGSVEGAVLSSFRTAGAIAKALQIPSCEDARDVQ